MSDVIVSKDPLGKERLWKERPMETLLFQMNTLGICGVQRTTVRLLEHSIKTHNALSPRLSFHSLYFVSAGNILSLLVLSRKTMCSSTYSYLSALSVCDSFVLLLTMALISNDLDRPVRGQDRWPWDALEGVYPYLFPYVHASAFALQVRKGQGRTECEVRGFARCAKCVGVPDSPRPTG